MVWGIDTKFSPVVVLMSFHFIMQISQNITFKKDNAFSLNFCCDDFKNGKISNFKKKDPLLLTVWSLRNKSHKNGAWMQFLLLLLSKFQMARGKGKHFYLKNKLSHLKSLFWEICLIKWGNLLGLTFFQSKTFMLVKKTLQKTL